MSNREKVELVELTDSDKAFEMMDEYAGVYGDNGGEPDGQLWLAENNDLPEELIAKLVEAGVAEKVSGWKVEPYTESNNYNGYCGYTSRNTAYTLTEETAIAIQNDEATIEESR
jgi:hypothetical protein